MKRFSLLGLFLGLSAAACGDNTTPGSPIDAPVVPLDAAIDGSTVATHSGTVTAFEVRLKNMGGAGVDGRGIQLGISFVDLATFPAPKMEESASLTDGCKIWEFTGAELASAVVTGTDQGAVTATVTAGSPTFPPCIYTGPAAGYACPDTASSGSAVGAAFAGANGASQMTVATPKFGPEDTGRYIKFAGTGNVVLDGNAFPIATVNVTGTIIGIGGATVNETLTAGSYLTLAGVGPAVTATPAVFGGPAADNITFAKPAGANFDAFPAMTGFPGATGVGDNFVLGTMPATVGGPNKVLPTTIPTDGSAFTIGCDTDADCGITTTIPPGGALGTILNIVTTDASIAGLSPFGFPAPAPTGKRVQVRCIKIGQRQITVPAAYSARLARAMSGANRIQTTFIRSNQGGAQNTTGASNAVNIAGGHAEVGFTTVP